MEKHDLAEASARWSVNALTAVALTAIACAPVISCDSESSAGAGGGVAMGIDGAAPPTPTDTSTAIGNVDSGGPPAQVLPGTTTAAALAQKLRGKKNFMMGLGNDDGQASKLGAPLDLNYAYLVANWPTWNSDAAGDSAIVTVFAQGADAAGMTPVFVHYNFADKGEGTEPAIANDATFMGTYWTGVRKMFQRLGTFGKAAAVIIEPDFLGFVYLRGAKDGSTPAKVTIASECAGLPDTVAGIAPCYRRLRDKYATKTVVGSDISGWTGTPSELVAFYKAIGASDGDFLAMGPLDRDAGCFEAGKEADCMRSGTGWYWDESNQTHPNFQDHLAFVKAMSSGVGVPVLWWQTPLGVPSTTPGGTTGHYRDNRVHYFFNHVDELIAAGGAGAMFGSGTSPPTEETTVTTDSGQFKNAAAKYFANPSPLP